MVARIGLISDQQTAEEIKLAIESVDHEVLTQPLATDNLDALLCIPMDDHTRARADSLMAAITSAIPLEQRPLCAALCTDAPHGLSDPSIVPLPTLSAFLEMTKLSIRNRRIETEAALRLETVSRLNLPIKENVSASTEPTNILFLGEPSSFFLKCVHDLRQNGMKVDSALTEHSAFELLRLYRPDAFIFSCIDGRPPEELLDHIHGRADLKELPVIAVLDGPDGLLHLGDIISGVIIKGPNDTDNLLQLLITLNAKKRSTPLLGPTHDSRLSDRSSGTFHIDFMRELLRHQLRHAKSQRQTHSVALVTPITSETGEGIPPARLSSFASQLVMLLRQEDSAARLNWSNFLISLPGTSSDKAQQLLRRVRGIIETTTAGKLSGETSFTFQVMTAADHHTADSFWALIEARVKQQMSAAQRAVA